MKKWVKKTRTIYGNPVRRECPTRKGKYYTDYPISGKSVFEVEVEVEEMNDFLYYKWENRYYGKNCDSNNLSDLIKYFEKFEGWKTLEEVN